MKYKLELIELQSRESLKTYHREHAVFKFYKKLHSFNKFDEIVDLARKVLCMWRSTYSCEQFFSDMKSIKTPDRNRLNDNLF